MANYSFWLRVRNHQLIFKKEIRLEDESIRDLEEMKEVLYDNSNLDFNCTLYRMYRGVYLEKDENNFQNIRHDLTLITPGIINHEFIKTYGHYHPKVKDKSFPEVYQVIRGKALFLLQNETAKEIFFVFAQEPEIVIIPCNFGHITINISKEDLVLANLVDRHFQSLYKPITAKKGGCFYILEDNPLKWVPNQRYKNINQPKLARPKALFPEKTYIYDLYKNNPTQFHWLNEPHQFRLKKTKLFEEKSWPEIKQELGL